MWDLSDIDRFIPRIKALATQNIRFTIICNVWNVSTEKLHEYEEIFDIHQVNFKSYSSYGKWLFSRGHIFKRLKKGLILDDIDIVFSLSGIWFQYYSEYFARKMNKPYVLFLRGNGFKAPEYQRRGWLKTLIRKYIYERNGWNPDLCIPITKDLIPLAQTMGVPTTKISSVVSGGIDIGMFRKMTKRPNLTFDKERIFTVGYAGRISKEKGSELLREVIDNSPDIRYMIVGKIQDKNFILRENVIYLGEVQHVKMPSFYNHCDVVLMTSFIEGFPRVLLESYACGVPVVATAGSIPSDSNIYGVVTNHTSESIIKWLRIYRGNNDVVRQTGNSARFYVKQFSLEKYARQMKKILENVPRGTVGVTQ